MYLLSLGQDLLWASGLTIRSMSATGPVFVREQIWEDLEKNGRTACVFLWLSVDTWADQHHGCQWTQRRGLPMGELVRLCRYLGCQYGCSDCHWREGEDGDQPVDRLGQLCQHTHCPGPDVQLNGLDQLQLQQHSLHLRHGNALHPLNLESPCSSCPCPTSLLTGLTLDSEMFSK